VTAPYEVRLCGEVGFDAVARAWLRAPAGFLRFIDLKRLRWSGLIYMQN
jgi:hypothetical protein